MITIQKAEKLISEAIGAAKARGVRIVLEEWYVPEIDGDSGCACALGCFLMESFEWSSPGDAMRAHEEWRCSDDRNLYDVVSAEWFSSETADILGVKESNIAAFIDGFDGVVARKARHDAQWFELGAKFRELHNPTKIEASP